eukprot:422271_1
MADSKDDMSKEYMKQTFDSIKEKFVPLKDTFQKNDTLYKKEIFELQHMLPLVSDTTITYTTNGIQGVYHFQKSYSLAHITFPSSDILGPGIFPHCALLEEEILTDKNANKPQHKIPFSQLQHSTQLNVDTESFPSTTPEAGQLCNNISEIEEKNNGLGDDVKDNQNQNQNQPQPQPEIDEKQKKFVYHMVYFKPQSNAINEFEVSATHKIGDGGLIRIPWETANTLIMDKYGVMTETSFVRNVVVIGYYDRFNDIQWMELLLDKLLAKGTLSKQFQSLTETICNFINVLDAKLAVDHPQVATDYMKYFITPWIMNYRRSLIHCVERGPVTVYNQDYHIYDNCIVRSFDDPSQLMSAVSKDAITCSFEDCGIYFDKVMFKKKNKNYNPTKSTILDMDQLIEPIPPKLTKIIVVCHGEEYFYRTIYGMTKVKASDRYLETMRNDCMGVLSELWLGEAGTGKTATVQKSFKFLGVQSSTSSIYKCKNSSLAGIRVFKHGNKRKTFVIEDQHTGTTRAADIIFDSFSDDSVCFKTVNESGESHQIFIQTSNLMTMSVEEVQQGGIATRYQLSIWLKSDFDNSLHDDKWEWAREQCDLLFRKCTLYFAACANLINKNLLSQYKTICKSKHEKYGDQFNLPCMKDFRRWKYNATMITVGTQIMNEQFSIQYQQNYGQWYIRKIIKRSAQFLRAYIDNPIQFNDPQTWSLSLNST